MGRAATLPGAELGVTHMKRLLAGGLALGIMGVGGAFLAGPGAAQEPSFDVVEHLDANLTPTVVQGGGTVTVTSVDPCPQPPDVDEPTDELIWAFGMAGWLDPNDPTVQPGDLVGEGTAPVAEDGSWEVTFTAPTTSGAYEFFAICLAADVPAGEDDLGDIVEDAAATLGGDDGGHHTTTTGTCSQQPCHTQPTTTEPPPPSTDPTVPPTETAVFLYGPEAFTVQGAPAPAPAVPGRPRFSG
jgi:hypothetical protein